MFFYSPIISISKFIFLPVFSYTISLTYFTKFITSSAVALFLFIILEVGISHNRFYVMGIGETLIRNVKNNLTEAMELYSLLKQQPVYLSRLDITKRDLPEILQPYCN